MYIALTAAASYIESYVYDPSAWTDATTAQRQAALAEATINIDRGHYLGVPYYTTQRLKFPRGNVTAYTEVGTPSTILQQQMKEDVERACCYQALFICRNAGRNEHNEAIQAGIRAKSESMGPIKEYVQYGASAGGKAQAQVLCQEVLDLLGRWRAPPRVYRG